ncbi:MAG: hypothetical protein JO051_06480 [Acidobacteriaceae bacterium]|nr:hypothetical protein [Acidobacteriaceae bacterium]
MRRIVRIFSSLVIAVAIAIAVVTFTGFKYAYEPGSENVISRTRPSPERFDLWGQPVTEAQPGAVKVDDALLRLGRNQFYKETFDNEIFLTDIVGILDGPLRITNVTKAVLALHGGWTTNLRVEVPETITIGGRTLTKGSYFDTGLDVPRGALVPMGMSVSISRWRIRVGITCAACHSTVDPQSGKVIEGAPNQDLNAGLLLALGTNSAAYFMHTDVDAVHSVPQDADRAVTNSTGQREPLPNIVALESAVDGALLMWPRGNFDSLADLKADPTQLPTSFTWGNHPYGWSGNFMAGPFHGLTSQNNNVHALNSDSLLLADSSATLFNIDKETYLAILLQNAAKKHFRFDPSQNIKPSEFVSAVTPTKGSPGINQVVLPPTYPKGTLLSPDGTLTSSPGYPFWQQNNAMAAWQHTIVPPRAPIDADAATKELGRQTFERAGCSTCHSGPFLTNNTVISNDTIRANPARALALQKTQNNFTNPVIFSFNTPVPVPPNAQTIAVPIAQFDPKQIDLAWARDGSPGGYKVPALVGLYWSAPYLHDGGVSVGKNANSEVGLPGTVAQNIMPDPYNSLRALVDRDLRARVTAANAASPDLVRMNVQGVGHDYWADARSGFTDNQQRALILYLLTYEAP